MGDCNGMWSIFGSTNCNSAKNTAGGNLEATNVLITYGPYLAAIVGLLMLACLFYCCYLKFKASQAKKTYRKELISLTTRQIYAPPREISHV
nr:putative p10 protein [Bat coronavirus GCCDC1]